MRFLGLSLGDRVPDATTIWLFDVPSPAARERLVKAGAIKRLFDRFDQTLRDAGYIAMSGQIVDASLVTAPKQRNTEDEKSDIKAEHIPAAWQEKPAKLRQKDRDARLRGLLTARSLRESDEWPPGHSWTVKFSKAKPAADGKQQVDIAIPSFGYQNHVSIDRAHGLICRWAVTDAAAFASAIC